MTPHHSAYSATQVALSPIVLRTPRRPLRSAADKDTLSSGSSAHPPTRSPPKYNSQLSLFGQESVSVTGVPEWESHHEQAAELVKKCEDLYQMLLHTETAEPDITGFKSI